jgi:hypothetical protein
MDQKVSYSSPPPEGRRLPGQAAGGCDGRKARRGLGGLVDVSRTPNEAACRCVHRRVQAKAPLRPANILSRENLAATTNRPILQSSQHADDL